MTTRSQLASEIESTTGESRFASGDTFNAILRVVEANIRRKVRMREQDKTIQIAVTSRETDLPADVLRIRSLTIDDSTDVKADYQPPESFRQNEQFSHRGGAFGTNTIFTLEGNTLLLAPTPTGTGQNVTLVYTAGFRALTEGADTNVLLQRHYDVYFWGCLWAAYTLDEDDAESAKYARLFDNAIMELNRSENRARFPTATGLRPIGSPHAIV